MTDKIVYVVQVDNTKDLSDAKRYGSLRAVFGNPRKPYNTGAMISKARKILENYKKGDYLLVIGDPTLAAVCMTIISEIEGVINVLSWDRNTFQYLPLQWNFDEPELELEEFETAE